MNQPKQPDEVPAEGASPDHNPTGTTPHGTPEDMADGHAKGSPNDGRGDSEKAALKTGQD